MRWFRLLPLVASLASALPEPIAFPPTGCDKNIVVTVLSAFHLSSFCTSFLTIRTQTVQPTATSTIGVVVTTTSTATITDGQTSTTVTSAVNVLTATSSVPGPTVSVTNTITSTQTSTSVVSVSTVKTVTVTTTSYGHQGGIAKRGWGIPPALVSFERSVISSACSCYVTTPTVTVTTTTLTTSTSTSVISASTTISPVVATVTSTSISTTTTTVPSTGPATSTTLSVTVTVTVSTTSTQTSTQTSTTTTTVAGPIFTFVASYNTHCVPYNYLNLYSSDPVSSYDANFQYCADQCAHSACSQIWVSDNTGTDGTFWCLTSSNAPNAGNFDKTWTSGEIQCNYPPIGLNAEWYRL